MTAHEPSSARDASDTARRDFRDRRKSVWTRREQAGRMLWRLVEATLFRWSPTPCNGWRAWLLRRFGASIGPRCCIRPSVRCEVPWNLELGEFATLGEHVIVYSLGRIRVGSRASVSQYSHLCGGTHDHTLPDMPLVKSPITIGDDAWVAADVFVGPGVTIGPGVVVGARSGVFSDMPAWTVCVGTPARPVGPREYQT